MNFVQDIAVAKGTDVYVNSIDGTVRTGTFHGWIGSSCTQVIVHFSDGDRGVEQAWRVHTA